MKRLSVLMDHLAICYAYQTRGHGQTNLNITVSPTSKLVSGVLNAACFLADLGL